MFYQLKRRLQTAGDISFLFAERFLRTECLAWRNSISHNEMFTTNLRVMKYEIHMLLKESTYETQTENNSIGCLNNTLPISKTGKAKRNISVKEVLCPHVPSVNICW